MHTHNKLPLPSWPPRATPTKKTAISWRSEPKWPAPYWFLFMASMYLS
jgi:hypothetical protein